MAKKNKEELVTQIMDLEVAAGAPVTATAGMTREQLLDRLKDLQGTPGASTPVETPAPAEGSSDPVPGAAADPGPDTGPENPEAAGTTAPPGLDPQLDPENPAGFTHILFLDQYNCMDFTIRMGRVRAAEALGKWVHDIITVKAGVWVDPENPVPPAGYLVRRDPKVRQEAIREAAATRPMTRR